MGDKINNLNIKEKDAFQLNVLSCLTKLNGHYKFILKTLPLSLAPLESIFFTMKKNYQDVS